MELDEIIEIYRLISEGSENIPSRRQTIAVRGKYLDNYNGIKKVAFDTRRIDQETEYNPRRGLQNYNRSESFLNDAITQKIRNFTKIQKVLQDLKSIYGKEPEWQDSNARVLLTTLDHGLRTLIKDGDYAENQPGVGSFDYLEELLFVRYRLAANELTSMAENDLKRILLSKDEELIHRDLHTKAEITKHDISSNRYDTLMEKLFGNIQANSNNETVERTVTITIRDSVIKKES